MPPAPETVSTQELRDAWPVLSPVDRVEGFRAVPHVVADDFFLSLSAREQAELLAQLEPGERRAWMRILPPDDAVDVVQESDAELRAPLLAELDEVTRREVQALLAYKEDEAGGLMNPRFARVRPEMSAYESDSTFSRACLRR